MLNPTKIAATLLIALSVAGCATTPASDFAPITDEKRTFVYDYVVAQASQKTLFKAARNYLATDYKNSKSVSRVEDESEGTIIGKAIISWYVVVESLGMKHSFPCASNYNLIFIAKDGKARLNLELLEGAAQPTACAQTLPTKQSYPQIVDEFNGISKSLENALNGKANIDALKNF